jgi:replicative DNA helicase
VSKEKYDSVAETGVLAGIAQHGKDALVDIQDLISVKDFGEEDNKIIFKCFERCLEKDVEIDLTTLYSTADELNLKDNISGDAQKKHIARLFNLPVKLENVRNHAKKLMRLSLIRAAQQKHREAWAELNKLDGSESVDDILSTSEAPIFDLLNSLGAGRVDIPTQIAEGGKEYLDHLIANPVDCIGIPTPWPRFNQAIGGGLTNGGVTLIAARPKKGKSSIGTNCAMHVAGKLNIPVLYLDTEMSRHQQLARCLSFNSNIDINSIMTGKFGGVAMKKNAVYRAFNTMAAMPYDHINIAGQDFETILGIIRRWLFKKVGLNGEGKANQCLIVYDYFKLMSDETLNKNMAEYQAMGFQISKLTDFAQKYDFPILSFVQVNRDGVSRDGTDVIAQSDRLLWLCHSLSIWKQKDAAEIAQTGEDNGTNKLMVLESRFGPGLQDGDYINFNFNKNICKLKELRTNFEVMKNVGNPTNTGFNIGDSDESDEEE